MSNSKRSWIKWLFGSLLVLVILAITGFQFAAHALKGQVEKALGPNSEVRSISVGLTGVEITGIRIRAPKPGSKGGDWPAEDQLRAERILVVPAIRDLLSARVVLHLIRIEGAYVSMLRAKDGRMRIVPELLEKPGTTGSGNAGSGASDKPTEAGNTSLIGVGKIELVDASIDFFDATIRQPPHKLRLEKINAQLERLSLPDLKGQSPIRVEGIIKGVRQDGKLSINGNIELASKESEISTRLNGVDLVALQPYLIKATESGVKKGSLDLDLKSTVKKGMLRAPGAITLSDLELASSSTSGTIMGIPRGAAIGMMKGHDGKISVKFVLEGNINDPRFSINENLATRIGASVADTLGVSVEGLAKGVTGVGGDTARGLGKLFGK